jgi:hypothetical protein
MITLEKASGASYTALCAYRNETCCCNQLAGVSSGHMAITSSYTITEAASGHYTIQLPDASFAKKAPGGIIKPLAGTGDIYVGTRG